MIETFKGSKSYLEMSKMY